MANNNKYYYDYNCIKCMCYIQLEYEWKSNRLYLMRNKIIKFTRLQVIRLVQFPVTIKTNYGN